MKTKWCGSVLLAFFVLTIGPSGDDLVCGLEVKGGRP